VVQDIIFARSAVRVGRHRLQTGLPIIRLKSFLTGFLNISAGHLHHLGWTGFLKSGSRKAKSAIIREKGVNGDREMAYSMYMAGFDVKDVHMTDLISGRETLEEIDFIVLWEDSATPMCWVLPGAGQVLSYTTKKRRKRWIGFINVTIR
jgi:hypothetical protein